MTRIGITGGIGSGKSYVCQLLQQRGIPVYSCDDEAKRLMQESPVIREQLCQLIGSDTYIGQQLNKPAIAQFLFADNTHAAQVNRIVHPVVREDFANWTQRQNTSIVAQESAILFEAGFQDTVDVTVLVYAPHSLRLQRAMKRDHATSEQIEARMAQQMDEEEKRRRADHIILNDGIANLAEQIDLMLTQIAKQQNCSINCNQ